MKYSNTYVNFSFGGATFTPYGSAQSGNQPGFYFRTVFDDRSPNQYPYDFISGNIIENNGGQGIELSVISNHNSILNNSIINNAKEGILVGGITSTENTIAGNNISDNQIGIRFTNAGSNTIENNNIQGSSMEGVLLQSSNENAIEKNNFIQNKRQAAFKLSSRNTWDANYWSNWIGFKLTLPIFQKFPKAIGGLLRLNFDWHPAKLPYNISTFA
jgi:parallel beta-helix repeat protein